MRFERLELYNWDIQANQLIVLGPGVNLLTGENGSGKTSILDALKVVLGVRKLGADRGIDEYLRKRSAPYAMIRLVADNRAATDTRARPFDKLGGFTADQVTLAVVFEATDDGYDHRYYLIDGDESPLTPGSDRRPFPRKRDFHDRLSKLGMGSSFRKLLRTPHGSIASLCAESPAELFNTLFDFIGGKSVLDQWQELKNRFEQQSRERQSREGVLEERARELGHLQTRLKTYRRYRDLIERRGLAQRALPYAHRRGVDECIGELKTRRAHLVESRDQADAAAERARVAADALRAENGQLDARLYENHQAKARAKDALGRYMEEQSELKAAFIPLDKLREQAAPLSERDLPALQRERARVDADSADIRHRRKQLDVCISDAEAELKRLDDGLMTPPAGVDEFRAVLQRAEIPHHLLMDLLDLNSDDPALRRALESYLGDLRFAVAVLDVKRVSPRRGPGPPTPLSLLCARARCSIVSTQGWRASIPGCYASSGYELSGADPPGVAQCPVADQ